jgi:3-carboxy-cis,cis-muconate cycloisomerase
MALCLKTCLDETDRALEAAVRALARKAREHRGTPMLGRTLMQPALPITAGLKIARWAVALADDRERLAEAAEADLPCSWAARWERSKAWQNAGPRSAIAWRWL